MLAAHRSEIAGVMPIEIIQRSGELLFVPSGWFHEVENLTDCISINHNWLNAHNVKWALTKLLTVLKCIKAALDAGPALDAHGRAVVDVVAPTLAVPT